AIAQGLKLEENANKYEILPFYIQKDGVWQSGVIAQQVLESGVPQEILSTTPNLWQFPPETAQVELWFPILHGPNGEDGTIQGLLTLTQSPFVGSGVLGSATGRDQIAMKMAF
ncbi:MAG: D-alanine--D-alanine ligase, partial [Dolichospermum sp.]